ncbi:ABC transporter permease, partial [Lachnoclostridium sp.]
GNILGSENWYSGEKVSMLDAIKRNKDTIHFKAGVMDEELIGEAIEQNAIMMANDDNYLINEYGKHLKPEAYIKYVLPYEDIVDTINNVYETNAETLSTNGFTIVNVNSVLPIDTLRPQDAKDFYKKVNQYATDSIIGNTTLSQDEKEKHMEMLSRVKIPFHYDYSAGYEQFLFLFQILSLVILAVIAICIAPIFADEYQNRTDYLLLSTRFGKNKEIIAKIFTGITLALGITIITLSIAVIGLFSIFGSTGGNMAIQSMNVSSTYPVTLLEATMISIGVVLVMSIFFAMLTLLFSSLFKSSFPVIILSFVVLIAPSIINVSPIHRTLYQILQIFPTKACTVVAIFSPYLFKFRGIVLTPAITYVGFAIVGSLIILPFAYRGFKNHQVG